MGRTSRKQYRIWNLETCRWKRLREILGSDFSIKRRKDPRRRTAIKIIWRRGKEEPAFNKPKTYFTLGQIDSGKSTLLEHIGIKHLENGGSILDVFGSVDGEGLAWLRSDQIENKEVLLLKGENVDVQTEHDCKIVENLTLNNLERYDLIISSHPLYLNRDH